MPYVRATEQRLQGYRKAMSLGKPKCVLEDILIKYNLPSGKPKRIEYGFSKIVAILNTLLLIAI